MVFGLGFFLGKGRRMSKPRVLLKCVADAHAGPGERIIEFSDGNDGTGGFISFRRMESGKLRVEVYHCENCEVVMSRIPSGLWSALRTRCLTP